MKVDKFSGNYVYRNFISLCKWHDKRRTWGMEGGQQGLNLRTLPSNSCSFHLIIYFQIILHIKNRKLTAPLSPPKLDSRTANASLIWVSSFSWFPLVFSSASQDSTILLSVHSGQEICPVNTFTYTLALCSSKNWLPWWQVPSFLDYLPFASSAFAAVPITLLNDKQI